MKSFTITITENETNHSETFDTNSLVALIGEDDGTNERILIDCNGTETANLIFGAMNVLKTLETKFPLEHTFAKIIMKEKERTGNDDE